jgi:hypothetical protein
MLCHFVKCQNEDIRRDMMTNSEATGATVLSLRSAARRLRITEATLRDARWRRRAGVPVVRVGGKLAGVMEADVLAVLCRGRERFDDESSGA